MRVYLAGPINGKTDAQAMGWRQIVKQALANRGITFVDPMARDYRGREAENVPAIVRGDKRDIDGCDLVLAYCWTASVGTSMEIHYASTRRLSWRRLLRLRLRVPVLAVCPPPVSPWIADHAVVLPTIGDAVVELARMAEGR